jgi:hypothetical protein
MPSQVADVYAGGFDDIDQQFTSVVLADGGNEARPSPEAGKVHRQVGWAAAWQPLVPVCRPKIDGIINTN